MLPGAGVLRMDADTVSAVNTHEKLFRRFREERIPILLGTQMVAKGLDFENVTLSAVLDADLSPLCVRLSRRGDDVQPDRAGRGPGRTRKIGRQGDPADHDAAEPDHPLCCGAETMTPFFEAELPLRQLRGCPPYRDLLTVTFHGREEERVRQAALAFRARLDGLLPEFYRWGDCCRAWPGPGLRCADQLSLSLPPDA